MTRDRYASRQSWNNGQAVPQKRKTNWTELGSQMMVARDYRAALQAFTNAAQADKSTAIHRFHMAQAHLALREYGPAAEQLTTVLRMRPDMADAARHLGGLAAARVLPANVRFDRVGLQVALDYDRINRDQIAEAAVYFLARINPLRSALELGQREGFLTAARQLCLKSTDELLTDDLLQKAISDNVIRMPDLELLLTALRQVFLLELPTERFKDRALVAFIISLMRQCWINEYVWSRTEQEDAVLAASAPDIRRALAGDAEEGVRVLLAAFTSPW